jgi:hypothetical protein
MVMTTYLPATGSERAATYEGIKVDVSLKVRYQCFMACSVRGQASSSFHSTSHSFCEAEQSITSSLKHRKAERNGES